MERLISVVMWDQEDFNKVFFDSMKTFDGTIHEDITRKIYVDLQTLIWKHNTLVSFSDDKKQEAFLFCINKVYENIIRVLSGEKSVVNPMSYMFWVCKGAVHSWKSNEMVRSSMVITEWSSKVEWSYGEDVDPVDYLEIVTKELGVNPKFEQEVWTLSKTKVRKALKTKRLYEIIERYFGQDFVDRLSENNIRKV